MPPPARTITAITFVSVALRVAVCAAPPNLPLDLSRLKELDNPKTPPVQRVSLGLRFYREEMLNPTPRPGPPFTDPKTHDYVLAQITEHLADNEVDLKHVKGLYDRANPGEVRDCLAILLGLKGEASVEEPLAKYVVERKNPMRLRELAAKALGGLAVKSGNAKTGEALAQALREDVSGQYKLAGKEMMVVYPVRRAAKEAIQQMEKEGVLLPSYVTAAAQRVQVEMKVPTPPSAAGKK